MMGKPLSEDLRKRMISFVEEGNSCRAAARWFRIAPRTAITIANRWKATGSIAALKQGLSAGSVLDPHQQWLEFEIARKPDQTLSALRQGLMKCGLTVTEQTIWYYLRRLGLTYKKTHLRR